jgi:hypothetical protein
MRSRPGPGPRGGRSRTRSRARTLEPGGTGLGNNGGRREMRREMGWGALAAATGVRCFYRASVVWPAGQRTRPPSSYEESLPRVPALAEEQVARRSTSGQVGAGPLAWRRSTIYDDAAFNQNNPDMGREWQLRAMVRAESSRGGGRGVRASGLFAGCSTRRCV